MPFYTNQVGAIPSLVRHVPFEVFNSQDTPIPDGTASMAVALPSRSGQHIVIAMEVFFPNVAPTVVNYRLEVASVNEDSRFYTIGPAMVLNGGGIEFVTNITVRFARVLAVDADTEDVNAFLSIN